MATIAWCVVGGTVPIEAAAAPQQQEVVPSIADSPTAQTLFDDARAQAAPNPAEAAGMARRLLDEYSAHVARADPALRAAFAETEEMRQGLVEALGGETERLQPRQRDAIRRAACEAARQGKVENLSSHRQARRTWMAPLAAAAVIIGGIFLITLFPKPSGTDGTKPVTANNDPVKGGGLEGQPEQ